MQAKFERLQIVHKSLLSKETPFQEQRDIARNTIQKLNAS